MAKITEVEKGDILYYRNGNLITEVIAHDNSNSYTALRNMAPKHYESGEGIFSWEDLVRDFELWDASDIVAWRKKNENP